MAAGLTILQILIYAIVILAAIGITLVAIRYFGITIPDAIVKIIWIVVIAAVAILAIKLIMTL